MPFLFHQNMRTFGGGTADRNAAYQLAFGNLAGALAVHGPIVVAGFTELTNNGGASNALRGVGAGPGINLCGALGVIYRATIACRLTAVGGAFEYIGIGTAGGAFPAILSFGRILIHAQGLALHLIHDIAPAGAGFANWCTHLPAAASADYQGIVYMVVTINGNNVAVAYTHNIYGVNDNRSALTQNLPTAANLIRTNPAMPGPHGVVYVCGDFNCLPIVRHHHHTVMTPFAQPTLAAGGLPVQFALNAAQTAAGGIAGGTTMAGNLYDYSFSTLPPGGALPTAGIDTRTMDTFVGGAGNMSDHVASILQV